MKSFAAFLIAAAAGVQAQVPDASKLTDCGVRMHLHLLQAFLAADSVKHGCLDRMVKGGGTWGCGLNDFSCLCKAPEFIYGIRDCSMQACGGDGPALLAVMRETCKRK
jgi:hypothetical protein